MVPPAWLQALCERSIGARAAEHFLGFSVMCSPSEALNVGYVDELCSFESLEARALQVCSDLTRLPSMARSTTKRQMRQQVAMLAGNDSVQAMADCVISSDFQSSLQTSLNSMKKKSRL